MAAHYVTRADVQGVAIKYDQSIRVTGLIVSVDYHTTMEPMD